MTVVAVILAHVHALQPVRYLSLESDDQRDVALAVDGGGSLDEDLLQLRYQDHVPLVRVDLLAPGARGARAVGSRLDDGEQGQGRDGQVLGVEDDEVRRSRELERDFHLAWK